MRAAGATSSSARYGEHHPPAGGFPYETPVVRGSPELYERNMIDELALRLVHGSYR